MSQLHIGRKKSKWKLIAILLLSIFVLYVIAGFIISNIMMSRYFSRSDKREYFSSQLTYNDISSDYPRKEISFLSGSNKLTGAVYGVPESAGLIVFVHGYGGNMDSYIPAIQFFVQHSWRVLVYNGTGVNDSGGDSRINLYRSVSDLQAALNYIKNDSELGSLPIALFGHSQGGFAVCAVSNYEEGEEVKAVVSFAGMNNAGDMVDVFGEKIAGLFYPLLKPFLYFLDFTDFFIGADKNAVSGINNTNAPVMLIQGTGDTDVPPNSAAITNFTEDIKNPNVEIVFLTDDWNNNHQGIFYSKSALEYRNQINESLEPYRISHGIDVFTDSDIRAWADEIQMDRAKFNELNVDIFNKINAFFQNAISQ